MLTKRRGGRPATDASSAPNALGRRIRAARQELGLTLKAVAGDDFTRAFLNQVELGRAQPSMHSLRIIATRLQRPIDYFLEDPEVTTAATELALAEAEMRLHQADPAGAERLLRRLLDRPVPLEIRTRAQLLLAGVHLRKGSAAAALPVLEEAIAAAERAGWMAVLVELYDRLGTVYYRMRRPHEAARWFDRALEVYEAQALTDPVLKARILGHRANLHYVAGRPAEAIAAYEAAIATAQQGLDPTALAGIYEGLALSFQQTGEYAAALSYAQKSLRIFETIQDVRMTGQLRLNMADMLLQQGRPAEAGPLFAEGAEHLRRAGDRELLPLLVTGMAESALESGAQERAAHLIEEALSLAPQSADPIASIAAHRVAGRIRHAQRRPKDAHHHFERALEIAATIDSPDLRARVTYDFARALEEEGDAGQAAVRFRQAYELGRPSPRR